MKVSADELSCAVWDADAASTVTISGTSARTAADLTPGVYYVISTTSCYFKQGTSSVTATSASNYLPADCPVVVRVTATANARIAFLQVSAGGTAFVMQPKGSP